MAQNYIVITSIFPPTEAVKKFSQQSGWQLIVVGDKKSPSSWSNPNTRFLSAEAQTKLDYRLIKALPWNHYTRKMIGYLEAISQGAEIIADTDDDNIPLEGWGQLPTGKLEQLEHPGFINIYRHYTDHFIWPRGLPLDEILNKPLLKTTPTDASTIGVWQYLANEDPDVDAIYRLTSNQLIEFEDKAPVALAPQTVSPFNSQNTFFHKELFPLLYLPAYVTFRFTDILRGLVAQPIMWRAGYQLGFGKATVVQKRNPHDYMKDFESEIPVYLHARRVIELVEAAMNGSDIKQNLVNAYSALHTAKIVTDDELRLLDLWLEDVSRHTGS